MKWKKPLQLRVRYPGLNSTTWEVRTTQRRDTVEYCVTFSRRSMAQHTELCDDIKMYLPYTGYIFFRFPQKAGAMAVYSVYFNFRHARIDPLEWTARASLFCFISSLTGSLFFLDIVKQISSTASSNVPCFASTCHATSTDECTSIQQIKLTACA